MDQENDAALVDLRRLPPKAIQAVYHAATGRTESFVRDLHGSVLVTADDIDHLYAIVQQSIAAHNVIFGPTISVVMRHENDKKVGL